LSTEGSHVRRAHSDCPHRLHLQGREPWGHRSDPIAAAFSCWLSCHHGPSASGIGTLRKLHLRSPPVRIEVRGTTARHSSARLRRLRLAAEWDSAVRSRRSPYSHTMRNAASVTTATCAWGSRGTWSAGDLVPELSWVVRRMQLAQSRALLRWFSVTCRVVPRASP